MDTDMTDSVDMLQEPEPPDSMTPTEIYQELMAVGEMILTIPAEEEDKLRKGLASAKSKQNAKLKEQGLAADNSVLVFNAAPSKDFEGAMQVHIVLSKRQGVTVLQKEYPNPDF